MDIGLDRLPRLPKLLARLRGARVGGVDFGAGIACALTHGIELRLSGAYLRYFYAFHPIPGDAYVAGDASGTVMVGGTLHTSAGSTVDASVQAHASAREAVVVAPPCNCDAAPASPNSSTNPCFSPSSLFDVRTSWGFGIRWFSPLGPLRFEWGFPFKPLSYEQGSVFEFTIGNFF